MRKTYLHSVLAPLLDELQMPSTHPRWHENVMLDLPLLHMADFISSANFTPDLSLRMKLPLSVATQSWNLEASGNVSCLEEVRAQWSLDAVEHLSNESCNKLIV